MPRHARSIRRQGGSSLLFTLMAMIVLAFAAVALTRSVDTSTLIMGNLGFKQDTLMASNVAAERAISWLQGQVTGASLDNDQAASGYYAATPARLDPSGNKTNAGDKYSLIDWDGDNCASVPSGNRLTCGLLPYSDPTLVNGNSVRYVILRLCNNTGAASGTNLCMRPAVASTATSSERGELQPGGRISTTSASPYYQVIVRVTGPRNTVSYTETLVHF
ncbi:pilus assembly PilX family protein [Ramlibacter sp. MMS24-I3-19]|uniref:pilus assembly PilX family protein n=1 Tax=Ramlibacter sp. MMS24-I3-19 TaxID=3416606 RepID=UPI003CFD40EC